MDNTTAGTIVVGVDGSAASLRALGWAAEQAVLEHRPLTVAHGAGAMPPRWANAPLPDRETLRGMLERDGREILAEAHLLAEHKAPGVEVRELFRATDPRELLLQLSRDAHLLVTGSRGLGRLRSLLLGSVGVATSRHASCPVVVHRSGHPGAVRRGVVVGADATEESVAVLEFAYRHASLRRLPLTVLHCSWSSQGGVAGEWLTAAQIDVESEKVALAESLAGLTEKYPDVVAHTEVTHGPAHEVLVRMSERMDLVVVGNHCLSRAERLVMGSVSTSLVEHAASPVAVVPVGAT
ncbi:MAG TPA: universal stress protein [Marmoricola sp.]|nr:universal stress protein [Marmoricola sp.]